MKKINIYWVFSAIILLALSGCFSPWEGDEAILTLRVGSGDSDGRALEQEIIDTFTHKIYLNGPSSGTQPITLNPGVQSVTIPNLAAGRWNIRVEAFNDDNVLWYAGFSTVTLRAGQNSAVSIKMDQGKLTIAGLKTEKFKNYLVTVLDTPIIGEIEEPMPSAIGIIPENAAEPVFTMYEATEIILSLIADIGETSEEYNEEAWNDIRTAMMQNGEIWTDSGSKLVVLGNVSDDIETEQYIPAPLTFYAGVCNANVSDFTYIPPPLGNGYFGNTLKISGPVSVNNDGMLSPYPGGERTVTYLGKNSVIASGSISGTGQLNITVGVPPASELLPLSELMSDIASVSPSDANGTMLELIIVSSQSWLSRGKFTEKGSSMVEYFYVDKDVTIEYADNPLYAVYTNKTLSLRQGWNAVYTTWTYGTNGERITTKVGDPEDVPWTMPYMGEQVEPLTLSGQVYTAADKLYTGPEQYVISDSGGQGTLSATGVLDFTIDTIGNSDNLWFLLQAAYWEENITVTPENAFGARLTLYTFTGGNPNYLDHQSFGYPNVERGEKVDYFYVDSDAEIVIGTTSMTLRQGWNAILSQRITTTGPVTTYSVKTPTDTSLAAIPWTMPYVEPLILSAQVYTAENTPYTSPTEIVVESDIGGQGSISATGKLNFTISTVSDYYLDNFRELLEAYWEETISGGPEDVRGAHLQLYTYTDAKYNYLDHQSFGYSLGSEGEKVDYFYVDNAITFSIGDTQIEFLQGWNAIFSKTILSWDGGVPETTYELMDPADEILAVIPWTIPYTEPVEPLTLSGQVYSYVSTNGSYREYTAEDGNFIISSFSGTGGVTNGQFNFTPDFSDISLIDIEDFHFNTALLQELKDTWDGFDYEYMSAVKFTVIPEILFGQFELYDDRQISRTKQTPDGSSIDKVQYIYVTNDVTISADVNANDFPNASQLNLELKKGWNILHYWESGSGTNIACAIRAFDASELTEINWVARQP